MKSKHPRFYLIITMIIFLIVFLGFTPTFYLRWFFDRPPRLQMDSFPWLFIIHGVVMTTWFVLLIVQSYLINTRKVRIHKKLGWSMVGLAILVVATAYPVAMGHAPRMIKMGFLNPENIESVRFSAMFWYNDMLSLIAFLIMVTIAILNRLKATIHRSMMLYATLAFMGPAVGRLMFWIAPSMPGNLFVWVNLLMIFSIPIAVLVYDWRSQKHFPIYSFIGFSVIFLMVVLNATLPATDLGLKLYMNHFK